MRALAGALLVLYPLLRPSAGPQRAGPCLTSEGTAVPLVERTAPAGPGPLVLLLTGDGGWASADEKVAEGLAGRGSPVVGVNMRAYLGTRRAPEDVARDLACVAREYLERWDRDRLVLLGYSRGADVAPLAAGRWPDDLRRRVVLVALVSLSRRANLQFHLIDLVRDVARPDDLPLGPEIARLRGLPVLCIYGTDDRGSGCPLADSTIVRRAVRPGGHRLTGGFDAIVELLAPALAPPGPAR